MVFRERARRARNSKMNFCCRRNSRQSPRVGSSRGQLASKGVTRMWKKHAVSAAVASLALGTGAAVSQDNDRPRQEQQRVAEAQLTVPRNADGTINTTALLDTIRTNVANGVR